MLFLYLCIKIKYLVHYYFLLKTNNNYIKSTNITIKKNGLNNNFNPLFILFKTKPSKRIAKNQQKIEWEFNTSDMRKGSSFTKMRINQHLV
jgi:ABC-type uncharacterized transport system substrate-binding protein